MTFDNIDYMLGIVTGILWMRNYTRPLPIKVTQLPPDLEPYSKWSECVTPIASKLTLAGKLGLRYTFNAEGAIALGKFMSEMGTALDLAVGMRRVDPPKKDTEKLVDTLTTMR